MLTFTSYSNVLCFVRYENSRSCHLSVRRMNTTEEGATKRVFAEMTLLINDSLIFLQVYQFSH